MATVRKYDKKFFAKANEVKKAHHKIPSMHEVEPLGDYGSDKRVRNNRSQETYRES